MVKNLDTVHQLAVFCHTEQPDEFLRDYVRAVGEEYRDRLYDRATREQAIADSYRATIDRLLADETLRQDWQPPQRRRGVREDEDDDGGSAKKRPRKRSGK